MSVDEPGRKGETLSALSPRQSAAAGAQSKAHRSRKRLCRFTGVFRCFDFQNAWQKREPNSTCCCVLRSLCRTAKQIADSVVPANLWKECLCRGKQGLSKVVLTT